MRSVSMTVCANQVTLCDFRQKNRFACVEQSRDSFHLILSFKVIEIHLPWIEEVAAVFARVSSLDLLYEGRQFESLLARLLLVHLGVQSIVGVRALFLTLFAMRLKTVFPGAVLVEVPDASNSTTTGLHTWNCTPEFQVCDPRRGIEHPHLRFQDEVRPEQLQARERTL